MTTATTDPPKPAAARKIYATFVKWSRRLTAFGVYAFLIRWWFGNTTLSTLLLDVAMRLRLQPLPPKQSLLLIAIAWYAFLSQLKIRWAIWLPIYIVGFPVCYPTWWLLRFSFKSSLRRLQTAAIAGAGAATTPLTGKTRFPVKRLWMLGFFIWLIALRTLDAAWAAWILPALMVPIWLWCLQFAYQAATAPTTFVDLALKACAAMLEGLTKQLQETIQKRQAGEKRISPTTFNNYVFAFVRRILGRYSLERILPVINGEALLLFTGSLVAALAMSAVFWGLVGRGIAHTAPGALAAYGFFRDWRFLEFVLWAFGCMTTSISFPGSAASTTIKTLHACILVTGLFQITYLFACFSITASAEGERTAKRAAEAVAQLSEKLEQTVLLEGESVTIIEMEVVKPPK